MKKVLYSSCQDFTLKNEFKKMTDRTSLILTTLTVPVSKKLSRESGKEKTKVRPDCSFAPTQLALCLRLACYDF